MDAMLSELIVAIVTAIIGYVIGIIKDRNYNLKIEDLYCKYKLFFELSGAVLKTLDEKLYNEVAEAVAKMETAYKSESFTTTAFNGIVLECKDVFDRAQVVLKNRG